MRGGIPLTPTQRKRLTRYRERAGLSLGAAARATGHYPTTWMRVESGEERPAAETLKKMADVVGLRLKIVLEEKPKR